MVIPRLAGAWSWPPDVSCHLRCSRSAKSGRSTYPEEKSDLTCDSGRAAAANSDNYDVDFGEVLENLEPDRALAGNARGLGKRVYVQKAPRCAAISFARAFDA
jgi:hypothetical protein